MPPGNKRVVQERLRKQCHGSEEQGMLFLTEKIIEDCNVMVAVGGISM